MFPGSAHGAAADRPLVRPPPRPVSFLDLLWSDGPNMHQFHPSSSSWGLGAPANHLQQICSKKIHQTARTLRRCRGLCLRRFPWTPGGPGCESKKICAGPPSLLWAESAQMEHQGCRLMQMTKKSRRYLRIVNLSSLLIIKPS